MNKKTMLPYCSIILLLFTCFIFSSGHMESSNATEQPKEDTFWKQLAVLLDQIEVDDVHSISLEYLNDSENWISKDSEIYIFEDLDEESLSDLATDSDYWITEELNPKSWKKFRTELVDYLKKFSWSKIGAGRSGIRVVIRLSLVEFDVVLHGDMYGKANDYFKVVKANSTLINKKKKD